MRLPPDLAVLGHEATQLDYDFVWFPVQQYCAGLIVRLIDY